jgi:hypothetical protein
MRANHALFSELKAKSEEQKKSMHELSEAALRMIAGDTNILVYSHREDSTSHSLAQKTIKGRWPNRESCGQYPGPPFMSS